jgi:(E)-4-hydroxy-3-methylbut-2-enyl-diphosphate synthase
LSQLRTCIPVCNLKEIGNYSGDKVLKINLENYTDEQIIQFSKLENTILFVQSSDVLNYKTLRTFCFKLKQFNCSMPLVFRFSYQGKDMEQFQINASTDLGGLFIDGFGDGISVKAGNSEENIKIANSLAFTLLQAARVRMSKTEYISCPSCGRTLFDLQETTAMIRKRTEHLKGVKIGIMGCIVNGPGEMADADYGYVGSGIDKITLYKGQEVVKRSISSTKAVDELIQIIKKGGDWIEPGVILE